MGHDITAYLPRVRPADLTSSASPEELAEEVAYLRGNYGIYECLDAQFYNAGVSGIGFGRWFTRDQLALAYQRMLARHAEYQKTGHSAQPAVDFLRTCLDKLPPDQDVLYIEFL